MGHRSAGVDLRGSAYLRNQLGDAAGRCRTYGYAQAGWTDLVDWLTAHRSPLAAHRSALSVDELIFVGVAAGAAPVAWSTGSATG